MKERGIKLQKAARKAEAQVSQIRREERRLKQRCVELAETVAAKQAEAAAALQRRRKLRAEVEQLRSAVEASEKADNARLQELYTQVRDLEDGLERAKANPLDAAQSKALQAAEEIAREEERKRWQVCRAVLVSSRLASSLSLTLSRLYSRLLCSRLLVSPLLCVLF
jgi:chromosome segregation ATPase